MNTSTDQQLLHDYTARRSESAFAELVRRHVDFVYSAALRMVRDAHMAEDVTQDVFVALARSARQLAGRPVLSGWLHRTAQNLAANTVRSDVRRRVRELEAATMNELLSSTPDVSWQHIAPQLDAALGELSESDRDALLLRYFERKSAQQMAQILGLSEEAAQKRVNRAVERLRDHFSKRNIAIDASGLAAVVSANAVQAAPVGLAATMSAAAALAGTAAHASTLVAASKAIALTLLQKAAITATLALVAGAGIYEARQAAQFRAQYQALQRQQTSLAEQIQQLQSQRDEATNRLASLFAENERMKSGQTTTELLKLRGEAGRMRDQLQGLPATRVALLKRMLDKMPEKRIPELALLTEKDWEAAAWNADLDSDDSVRVALRDVRNKAVDVFYNLTRPALKEYLAANNGVLPSDLLALKPYFDAPVTDEMLQRYAFTQTGVLSPDLSQSVVTEAAPNVDEDYDSHSEMSMNGGVGNIFNRVSDAIAKAAFTFTIDNNGKPPTDPSQIASYLSRSIDAATVQKYLGPISTDIAANFPPAETTALLPAFKAYAAAKGGDYPEDPSQLLPYLTTPEQQAALHSLYKNTYPSR
ncbi:MAG TPA: sigma-70 family RNA polymerase sigma factor [Candidatus Baltobacteraceae bacterium]|nr:sigma-70 family RNA polymerase sigma factor [Candidatus Baltobacteraceae bacterium]